MNKQIYKISDYFCGLVDKANGAAGFAEKYGLKASVINAYYNRERRIQITTLISLAAIIDLQECPKCPRTTIDELKKAALLLIEEKADFEVEWEKMFT